MDTRVDGRNSRWEIRLYGHYFEQLLLQGWLQLRPHSIHDAAQMLYLPPDMIIAVLAGAKKAPDERERERFAKRIRQDLDAELPGTFPQLMMSIHAYLKRGNGSSS